MEENEKPHPTASANRTVPVSPDGITGLPQLNRYVWVMFFSCCSSVIYGFDIHMDLLKQRSIVKTIIPIVHKALHRTIR